MSTYNKVAKWNDRCGNRPLPAGTPQYYEALQNQLARIVEEANEAQTAIQDGNILEVIDAGLDLDVVVAGFNYLAGGDYNAGIDLVLGNNDLKYTKSKRKAQNWLTYNIDNGTDSYLSEAVVGSQTFYCVRRKGDAKIMKPGNFPKVDLTPVLPKLATIVSLLLDDSEVAPNEDQQTFIDQTGILPIYLDRFPEDDVVYDVMAAISKEADGQGAFVFLQNGHVIGAEKFSVGGPGSEASAESELDKEEA